MNRVPSHDVLDQELLDQRIKEIHQKLDELVMLLRLRDLEIERLKQEAREQAGRLAILAERAEESARERTIVVSPPCKETSKMLNPDDRKKLDTMLNHLNMNLTSGRLNISMTEPKTLELYVTFLTVFAKTILDTMVEINHLYNEDSDNV